jgi:hypothetical protein
MVAPTFVSQGVSAWNTNTTPKTLSIAVTAGDTVVIYGLTDNDLTTISTPSDGVNTFTLIQSIVITDFCWTGAWKMTASTSTTLTVSCTRGGTGGDHWGIGYYVHRNSGGVGASSKTNVNGGAPSLALTTGSANSAIINVVGDWNAIDGTSTRVWRTINSITPSSGAGTEGAFSFDTGLATFYSARWTDAGAAGSKTTGLSAPTGQKYTIIAIEILPSAGGTDVNVTDAPSGVRSGQSDVTVTFDVLVVDAPSGSRLGQSPLTVSIGVNANDTPSGVRLGASLATVSFDVITQDTPSGMRGGASLTGVVIDSGVVDTPSGARQGQSASTVRLDMVIADSPSGVRAGQSGAVVGTAVQVQDVPNGTRLGQSSTVVTVSVAFTDSAAGLRAGQSGVTVVADVMVADSPSGVRLGASGTTVTSVTGVGDVPSGVRLSSSPVQVTIDVRTLDTPSGARLGLSPSIVSIGGVPTNVTVADQPSGARSGASGVVVTVSLPVVDEPTIFAVIGEVSINARSRPFVFDASVGVNVHAIVGEVVVEATVDGA